MGFGCFLWQGVSDHQQASRQMAAPSGGGRGSVHCSHATAGEDRARQSRLFQHWTSVRSAAARPTSRRGGAAAGAQPARGTRGTRGGSDTVVHGATGNTRASQTSPRKKWQRGTGYSTTTTTAWRRRWWGTLAWPARGCSAAPGPRPGTPTSTHPPTPVAVGGGRTAAPGPRPGTPTSGGARRPDGAAALGSLPPPFTPVGVGNAARLPPAGGHITAPGPRPGTPSAAGAPPPPPRRRSPSLGQMAPLRWARPPPPYSVAVQNPSLRSGRQPEHHTEVARLGTSATAAGPIVDVGPTLPQQDSTWARTNASERWHGRGCRSRQGRAALVPWGEVARRGGNRAGLGAIQARRQPPARDPRPPSIRFTWTAASTPKFPLSWGTQRAGPAHHG